MVLQAPQLIYLATVFLALGISMTQHGQVKTEKKNFLNTLVGVGIQMGLMYWGGFFS